MNGIAVDKLTPHLHVGELEILEEADELPYDLIQPLHRGRYSRLERLLPKLPPAPSGARVWHGPDARKLATSLRATARKHGFPVEIANNAVQVWVRRTAIEADATVVTPAVTADPASPRAIQPPDPDPVAGFRDRYDAARTPAERVAVIVDGYRHHRSASELAQALGETKGNVTSLLERARRDGLISGTIRP